MSSNISSSNMNSYTNIYGEKQVFSITKVRNKKKWTREEDLKLIKLAEKNKEKHWKEISKNFLNKNPLQCFSRYKRIKPGIIKGTWTREEDDRILSLVSIYGKSWSKLAKIMKSRNGKQIRDRFINVLDPDVKKGKFTSKEDKIIKDLYKRYGPRWATIARGLPNRTPDMIKNRFHSSIKKYLHRRNFLSKSENRSKRANRESENTSREKEAPMNISNSVSDLIISNSKSLAEKNFLYNFSHYSSSIQDVNLEQNIFQNRINQMFYNDNRINLNSVSQNQIRENNIFINENENNFNPFDKNLSFHNFSDNVKNECKSLRAIKTDLNSKLKEAEIFNDSERTVSNSDYSIQANERNIQYSTSKFSHNTNNNHGNEINENNFEYPDMNNQSSDYLFNNSKIDSDKIKNNTKNQSYFIDHNNCQINSLKNNFVLSNFECRGVINQNNSNGSTFPSANLNDFLEQQEKFCRKEKANQKKFSKGNGDEHKENINSNKNKLLYNEIIKNDQESEKFKENKISEFQKKSNEEKMISEVFLIESHLYHNYQNNNDLESHTNKNYFLSCNEISRSTNLVTCQNISSYSSNSYTLDEHDHSSHENYKNNNGNSYIISGVDDNYQMNFMNFADSPFRMSSPKYYDFEDFFKSN